jgi:hypothetical protein
MLAPDRMMVSDRPPFGGCAPKRGVPMWKPAETADDIRGQFSPLHLLGITGRAHKRKTPFSVWRIFGVFKRQIEKPAYGHCYLLIEALLKRTCRNPSSK